MSNFKHKTTAQDDSCFHCGLPVPASTNIHITYSGEEKSMCCHGCEAVANAIISSGMDDFYRYRTTTPEKPEELVPEFLQQLKAYDNPQVQKRFIHSDANKQKNNRENANDDIREVSLILEGIVCAACVWLNENHLQSLAGVLKVNINYSNHRATVRWDNQQISLSEILESISRIGYLAHPYDPDSVQRLIEKERKQQLKRIGISGVLGMQIMILAVAMYSGHWWGIDAGINQFFRWTSLVLTVPVLLFASDVFLKAAWRDLKNRRVGMDVPVSLGISIAFIASAYHTFIGSGEVYFDSVVMFTFFLLSARYFELNARKRTSETTEALLNLRPAIATRLLNANTNKETQETIAVSELNINDLLLVRPGETLPADGRVEHGTSGVNESLLTGESLPITKTIGDKVIGGSINTESPLSIRVEKLGDDSVLSSIQNLLEQAQNNKPAISQLADRIASWFVASLLTLATGVAIYWYLHDPAQWISITVATLVVTCPCALSLATPAAITAASGQLARIGLLPKTANALETLAQITDFVFDKTGTLTEGKLHLKTIDSFSQKSEQSLLQIAAVLESASEHPIARCIVTSAANNTEEESSDKNIHKKNIQASNRISTPGYGVEGTIDEVQWFIGNSDYIIKHCQNIDHAVLEKYKNERNTSIFLATQNELQAAFTLGDSVRSQSSSLVSQLIKNKKAIHLFSGDSFAATKNVATILGIPHYLANLRPQDKLQQLQQLQAENKQVAMTGDGINDAPVLAAANLSIAMGKGSQLAVSTADMVLLSSNVLHIYTGYTIAKKCMRIIRQNLTWAIAYNLIAIPAAAMGYVEPWLAAIGMSASSLFVVLNALRLTKHHAS